MNSNFPSAVVICHSQAPNDEELITLEIELHRFILPEFNTHRLLSRNFQSSRAVPISKMIEQVMNDPAMPVHWGKNQAGMVAEKELDVLGIEGAKEHWLIAAKQAAFLAQSMENIGVHKQVVNRILEPFMKTKGVVTATRKAFESFFKLRCHYAAQPEIKLLAERMRDAINNSTPDKLNYGEYHLPYVNHSDFPPSEFGLRKDLIAAKIKVSSSCAAQVSYRRLDDSLDKAIKVYDMLNLPIDGVYPDEPPHYSPTEHIAKVVNATTNDRSSGNFHSKVFWQYRKALEMGIESEFIKG